MPDKNTSLNAQLIEALPTMRRYSLSICRDSVMADELVQDACERALAADGPQGGTPFLPWLFTIIKNRWFDILRARKSHGTEESEDALEIQSVSTDEQSRWQARSELSKVEQALTALNDDQRELLRLVCIEELSYKEVSQQLGVPMGTVMSRLARARLRLAEVAGLT
jgi:RNA polymerase sigma-70 factor, ECF subfamily